MSDERLQNERAFFNETFAEDTRKPLHGVYAITRASRQWYTNYLRQHCAGRRVLSYGCGVNSDAFWLVEEDAQVTGIDISDVAVDYSNQYVQEKGLLGADFAVMDAEAMTFPDQTFDLICGTSILHHLDLDKSLGEIRRVLKPDGRAIFIEPLGHNPAINLFRRLTPQFRTADEHPLTMRELAQIRAMFTHSEVLFFHLFDLLSVPLRKTRVFGRVSAVLGGVDRALLRLPLVRRWAWQVVIVLENPSAQTAIRVDDRAGGDDNGRGGVYRAD